MVFTEITEKLVVYRIFFDLLCTDFVVLISL